MGTESTWGLGQGSGWVTGEETEDEEGGGGGSRGNLGPPSQLLERGVWVGGDLGILCLLWRRMDPAIFPQISGLLGLFSEVLNPLEGWHPWLPTLA